MIWACFIVIIILDIYVIVYFKKCNAKLREEVKETREWCNRLLVTLEDQEEKISQMINQVIKDIEEDKK